MKTFRLSLLILMAALALAGCGRKNLPVAPRPVTTPIGETPTPNSGSEASSTVRFQRAARVTGSGTDLAVTPAEVSRNPTAEKKSFPLDFLLN